MQRILITIVVLIGATLTWLPSFAREQEDAAQKVKASMSLLQSDAEKLGSPKLEGKAQVANLDTPALYFGSTKINNNFDLVDSVAKEMGGTATIFVKNGENFVRVATNVKKDDGSRAIGTILDPKGPVIQNIRNNQPYYGEANILGKNYMTAYVPIHDAANKVIGIYYVGYMK
jgi:Cache 3/Cache 2 fusion domain